MKQTLNVNDSGFTQLLEFITPSHTAFPSWSGSSNLVGYEMYVRTEKVDTAVDWLVTDLGWPGIARLIAELEQSMLNYCPNILSVLAGRRDLASLPDGYGDAFPLCEMYGSWAKSCRWSRLLLEDTDSAYRDLGLVSYPPPTSTVLGGGLEVGWESVRSLYPPLADVLPPLRDTIAQLVSSMLPCYYLPICFKSTYQSEVPHPWVALLCETLVLVGSARRGIVSSAETQYARVKRVVGAIVHDRLEFAWAPRKPYRHSPGVTQKMWFEQVAESMQNETPRGSQVLSKELGGKWMQQYISSGLDTYHISALHCGMPSFAAIDAATAWGRKVVNYTMFHSLPIEPQMNTINTSWVRLLDREAANELQRDE